MYVTKPHRGVLSALISAVLAAILACAALVAPAGDAGVLSPGVAHALETVKCTARSNSSSDSSVLGGAETRITWEGQADADETLSAISLDFPSGTTFGVDDARITMLTGDDLMTRTFITAECADDNGTFVATLADDVEPGAYFRVEVYEVSFPIEGGPMQIEGTYQLSDGSTRMLEDVPVIDVKGVTKVQQLVNYLEEQPWVQAWNENKFLRLFVNPPILVKSLPVVAKGFLMAVGIVLVAFPLAIPFGLVLSIMRMSKMRILRAIASFYVNIIRGTPVFLQIYIAFFGLPLAGIVVPNFLLGVIVLAMNSCAYQCEIFRGGIQSIHKGQFEAARSLGMNGFQTMFSVIIPQVIPRVIPTMTSEFILLYKDTSLLAAVGVMEIVMYAKTIVATTGSITPYIVAAVFYLVLTLPLAKVVGILEGKLSEHRPEVSEKPKKKSKEA